MSSPELAYRFGVIGTLESCFSTKNGTPRQSGLAPASRARLKIESGQLNNPDYSLRELEGFSHVWVLFVFHLDQRAQACAEGEGGAEVVKSTVAPPRLGGRKVGLFATRSPHRPAPIGLSLVKLEAVVGDEVHLSGGDFVEGTPVLDIKPYLPSFDAPPVGGSESAPVFVPEWASAEAVRVGDLHVAFTARARGQLKRAFLERGRERKLIQTEEGMIRLLGDLLSGDPRSVYRRDRCSDRLYFVELDGLHVTAWFDQREEDGAMMAEVLRVRPL